VHDKPVYATSLCTEGLMSIEQREPVPSNFEMQVVACGGDHTVILGGELDMASAPSMEAALAHVCTNDTSVVRLDLSKLGFIDSSGIRAVLAAKQLCAEHDCGFLLVPGQPQVQRAFALTGVLNQLNLPSDRNDHVDAEV
jgi:anti-anti-sigma factor